MVNFYETYTYFCITFFSLIIILYLARKEIYQVFFGYGVPFIPTGDRKIDILVENLEIKKGQRFLDLGAGDGRILEAYEKKYIKTFGNLENFSAIGIENSPYPYKIALNRKIEKKLSYELKRMNFFKEDFSKYDIIYAYSITYLMNKIRRKIKKECKKGTIFYSNSFKILGEQEIKKIPTNKKNFIYVYEV